MIFKKIIIKKLKPVINYNNYGPYWTKLFPGIKNTSKIKCEMIGEGFICLINKILY